MGPPTKAMTPKKTLLGKNYLKAMSDGGTMSSGVGYNLNTDL